jgi:hypothetical protein
MARLSTEVLVRVPETSASVCADRGPKRPLSFHYRQRLEPIHPSAASSSPTAPKPPCLTGSVCDCPSARACRRHPECGAHRCSPLTLEDRLKALVHATDGSYEGATCDVFLPELLDRPSVDLSQLTLRVTEDDERTQTLTVAVDQDCRDGWRLKDRGDTITLCGSLCEDILYKTQQADLTLEFQFSCL